MPESSPDSSDEAAPAERPSRLRRWGRRAGRAVGATVIGGLLLLGALLLVLQTDSGATAAVQWGASVANPLPNTTLAVEGASGSWLRSLRLTGITLSRTDSSGTSVPLVQIDTLAARYRLRPLLDGRVHVESLSVVGPTVRARQAPDSTWDWARVLPAAEPPPEEPDTSAGMPIRIDRIRVVRGSASAAFHAATGDSTARVGRFHLRASDLRTAPTLAGRVDTLGLRGRLPGDPTDLTLAARGALTDTGLTLDTLRLDSPRSRVRGHGQVRLPEDGSVEDGRLRLRAAPLALRDLTLVAPALDVDPTETVRLDLAVEGGGRHFTARADGRFSGGGTLRVRAATTPATPVADASPLRYRLDARVRDLTTSLLGPVDSTQNRLSAGLDVTLSGSSLATLDGTTRLRVTDTRWGGLQAPTLTLASTLRDGTASVDLQGTMNAARVQVTGQVRSMAEAPEAALTARVRNLDLARIAPDAGIESALAATAEVQARALGTDEQALDVRLTLDSSRVGVQPISGGRATLAVGPRRARVDGRIALRTGTVEVAGSAALDDSEQFVLERLRLDRVDPAALLGDTTASRLSGTMRVEGRGFTPETMRLEASLDVPDAHYGLYRLSALTAQASLENGRLTATTDATLNGGTWSLAATARPFAPTPTAELTRGRFESVDVGPLVGDTTRTSRLQGTLQAGVQGTDPGTMTADARLRLGPSRLNRQRIEELSLETALREGQLDVDLSLDTPEGRSRLAATAHPFDDVPRFRVTEGAFEDLDVGGLAGLPGFSTALSGTLALDGQGGTPSTLTLDGRLELSESSINDAALSGGRLAVGADRGQLRAEGQFAVAGGEVALEGRVDSLSATPTYVLRTSVGTVDAGALAGLDAPSVRIDSLGWTLDGRGLSPSTLAATTRLVAREVQVGPLRIRAAEMGGTLRRGQLALDTLSVWSNAFVSTGSGTLAIADTAAGSNFSFETVISNAGPLRPLVGAERLGLQKGTLEARVYGPSLAQQRFDGELTLSGLLYDDVRLADAEVNFNGRRGRDQLFGRVAVNGQLGYLSTSALSVDRTRLNALYDGAATDVSADVRLDPTHNASLEAQVTADGAQTTVALRRLALRLGGDRWSLLQDATLTVGEKYQVRGLLLRSGRQQIAVDGVVDPTGEQSLVATVEEVRLGALSALGGLSGLDGRLSGALQLDGPATAPRLDSRLALDLRSEQQPVGTLRLRTDYRDHELGVDATLTHTDGGTLTAAGTLPVDLRLQRPTPVDVGTQPVRLNLSTERFPVDWVDPFLDPATLQDVRGVLAADVQVRGSLEDPDLGGTASLTDGGASLPALETRYRDAAATLRLDDDQLQLENAVLRSSNGGRLRADGVINFPQLTVGQYDLSLKASDFIAIDTRAYRRAVIDGSMTLRGTTDRPTLLGTVRVQSADIYYNDALAESEATGATVPLTDEDQLTLEKRFGLRLSAADTTTFDAYEALTMNLRVQIEGNTWLRSTSTPEMNIQFTGDLDLSKVPTRDAQVFGSIEVETERSTLRQFGQEFQITEGMLTFNGDPAAPYLVLEAVYEQRARGAQGTEVTITLRLRGRPEDLSPSLSSEPPMDTRNILSYLATGRPADELLSGSGEGNLATQVALGQATNFVENLAASELGLDVVRVQLRTSGASYLTVGRYFTPRFFVSIEQPVATSNLNNLQTAQYLPDLTLEYQLRDTLMLRALNNQQSFQLNLLFEYAY